MNPAGWAAGTLGFCAKRPILVLFVVCFVAWFPGFFTLPPLDRDESRFAQATKQMLETGDFIDIRFGSGVRYKKPAGIHWLQSVPTALFNNEARTEIWTYRVPSFIGAFVALVLMFWLMRAFASRETAFLGALILGVTVLVTAEAKIAKTDAVLLATVLATQGVLIRAYLSFRNATAPPSMKLALIGWAAFGVGVLIKGPILPAVLFVTIVGISLFDWERPRWFKTLHPWWGLLLAAVIVLPWGIAIGIESSGLFYEKSLGEDFAAKIASGQETHGAPPGYYTALVSFSFWPATLLLFPAIAYGIIHRKDPVVRYLLAWAAACWLMFEATPTKLPHYILPAYPALAFLGAVWLTSSAQNEARWLGIARRASIVIYALVGLFFAYLIAFAPNHFGYGSTWWLHVGGALGALAVVAAAVWAWRGARVQAVLAAGGAAAVLYAFAGFGTVPRLQELWLSPRLVAVATKYMAPGDPPPVLSGYTEPSMVFLLGTETRLERGDGAGRTAAKGGGLALIERRQEGRFLEAVVAGGASAAPLETVEGMNYSRGRWSKVTIYRVTPGGPR
jgi:4-amino-4-deoxy-L-arabinose transferase-like glycosyltransferase